MANLHALLLLSDSALPLGSFAFSSGLESFLAHSKPSNGYGNKNNHATQNNNNNSVKLHAFDTFLDHSLANLASTALPYVLTAYHSPAQLEDLDNDFDAATPCTVARRASVAQGRALLAIWERALSPSSVPITDETDSATSEASHQLSAFATALKVPRKLNTPIFDSYGLNAHFPPLFGAVCRALGLSEQETAYLFLLNHAKALLSAGVRASVMGPYQSQAVLASAKLQRGIHACIAREAGRKVSEAAVTVPVMDLWMGRHELLYSRIFNS